jgi:hypothetical protein
LEKKYHHIIERALGCYQSNEQMIIGKEEAEEYCDYMLRLIFDNI